MLVLARKTQQQIQIGNHIVVTVLEVKGKLVRLGIEAPRRVRVMRCEIAGREPGTPEAETAQGHCEAVLDHSVNEQRSPMDEMQAPRPRRSVPGRMPLLEAVRRAKASSQSAARAVARDMVSDLEALAAGQAADGPVGAVMLS